MSDILIDLVDCILSVSSEVVREKRYKRRYLEGNRSTYKPKTYNTETVPASSTTVIEPVEDTTEIRKTVNMDKAREINKKVSKQMKFRVDHLKLEILILSYIYVEDDGKLSLSEKNKLKKHYKKDKSKLTKYDIEEICSLTALEPSLNNIRSHISQNDLTEEDVTLILKRIKKLIHSEEAYMTIFNRIENHLFEAIGY